MFFFALFTILWTVSSCGVTIGELPTQEDNPWEQLAEESSDQDGINFKSPDWNGFDLERKTFAAPTTDWKEFTQEPFDWKKFTQEPFDWKKFTQEPFDWKKFTVDTNSWERFTPLDTDWSNLDKIEFVTITWEEPVYKSRSSGNATLLIFLPILVLIPIIFRKCFQRNPPDPGALARIINHPTTVNSSSAETENTRVALIVVSTRLGDNSDSASADRRDETDKPPDYFDVVSADSRDESVQLPETRLTNPGFPPPSYDEHARDNRQN